MLRIANLAAAAMILIPHWAGAVVTEADVTTYSDIMTEDFGAASGFFPTFDIFGGTDAAGTLSAPNDLFADTGFMSTDFDADPINIVFDAPVFALGVTGGIADLSFGGIDGVMRFTIDGQVFDKSVATALTNSFGFVSDTGFASASIDILNFDLSASSVGFVALESISASATPVPIPAGGLLLGAACIGLGLNLNLRRRAKAG